MPGVKKRILFTLAFFFLLFKPLVSSAQDLEHVITVKLKNKPFIEALQKISEAGHIYFSYNPQLIPSDLKVTLRFKNKPIREVLDYLLPKAGLGYNLVENQVVLKKLPIAEQKMVLPGKEKQQNITISGYIHEKSTGEALIGANVWIRGTSIGTSSNGYGFFSLTVPEGEVNLLCSFVGYKDVAITLKLSSNREVSIDLEESQTEIKEVEVVSGGQPSEIKNNQLSDIAFNQKTLGQLPGFAGDIDVIRALQVVPGIQTFGDGSSFYYVRGGNSDQNLLLIDEVPVYNPSHLFGFFSAFSPDAINDVRIYKGDFPAKYGGRLSSVIDIKAKDGNLKKFGISGNVGPYASSLTAEGPIVKDHASFFVSGRISTLNWLNGLTTQTKNLNFLFYDLNAKVNYLVNNRNRIFATFYTGNDDFSQITNGSYRTYGISWNNVAGILRWNHVFNSRLFSTATTNYSRYNYYLYISPEQNDYWNSSIANLTFKADLSWYLNPDNTLKAGIEISSHQFNPGNVSLAEGSSSPEAPSVSRYNSMEYDLYMSNDQHIGKRILVRYGIRLPLWQDIGPATVYYFNVNHQVSDTLIIARNKSYSTFFRPEPRICIEYSFRDKSFIKASYSRATQFIQILSNSISPFTTLAVWVPSGPTLLPQTADQFGLGYFRNLAHNRFSLSAEVYYKYINHSIDYKDHADLLYNPLLEGEVRQGNAWSYGVELMLRKTEGNLTGWIGYTYSSVFLRTEGVNNYAYYPASYDRPHDFCINIAYTDKKHWSFSANWMILSGGAITTPIGFYYNNGYSVPIYGDRNNERLPVYHRLDLSAGYQLNKPGNRFKHSLTITVYNAYGRFNPYSVNFNKILDDHGEYIVPSNINGKNQLIPTTMSVAGMIPSINYQFRF